MKYTLCADEIFIQTILWNSPFRERMHCTNNANTGSMREIDWEHGSPYIWQDHDYQTLINSNKIFARKFNSNQMGVVYKIQKLYNPQIKISAESETKRSIFREKDKTKRSKKESAQHSKSRNKSFVMTSVSAL